MAPGSLAGHSCAPGSGISVRGGARHSGGEEVGQAQCASAHPPYGQTSERFWEDRSFLSPCDTSLIFWPALWPPMVWELSNRHQRPLPNRRLTMGPCQHEAQAMFLSGRGQPWPVEFSGFVRHTEVHVTKLASLSWPQAPSEFPGPATSESPFYLFLPRLISAKLSGAC